MGEGIFFFFIGENEKIIVIYNLCRLCYYGKESEFLFIFCLKKFKK